MNWCPQIINFKNELQPVRQGQLYRRSQDARHLRELGLDGHHLHPLLREGLRLDVLGARGRELRQEVLREEL